ncbi:MAG: COG4315 family predicted lipoprotein [Gaiellaceae bacterium]
MKKAATLGVSLLALAAVVAVAGAATLKVVSTAHNARLHKTILVNKRGLTLYSLSVERHGKFVCTGGCLSFWTPLTVKKGQKPAGVPGLATVKRPDHKLQVAYRGAPLYTFYLDRKRGDIGGNGFRDVGTWHPVAVRR